MAQLMWQGVSSTLSMRAYAGVCELVASRSARCEPADMEITPIFSGSKPRFAASRRTRRTARWPSSQADW